MNYEEVVNFLYAQLPVFHRVGKKAFKPGLDNIQRLADRIGNPQDHFKSLHIAGTNGKGSSSHFIASILQEQGFRVGLYTSPHLKSFTERIKVNGQEVSKDWVVDFFIKNQSLIADIKPSFFEWTVLMTFAYFQEQKVDYAIIETGLGGRLDSTNIIQPLATYITNIGYDHQDILGDTLAEIASQKAGIIKWETPVLISEFQDEIANVFLEEAKRQKAPIQFAKDLVSISELTSKGVSLHFMAHTKTWGDLAIESPYAGTYQAHNIQGVIAWCEQLTQSGILSISGHAVQKGISASRINTQLRGRWDMLNTNPWIVADTAHNASGISEVLNQVNKLQIKRLHIILGMVADKDIERVLALFPRDARYYFTQSSNPRALAASELAMKAKSFGLMGNCYLDVNMALAEAQQTDADFILITGSTYLVAEISE